jgi:hypothetical protein
MRTNVCLIGLTALAVIFAATDAQGQFGRRARGSGGWGPGADYCRKFDPKTIETINGEVISVDRFKPGKGMSYGIHLQLKTDKESIPVHLGPAWYMDNQDTDIEVKDKITVKGSRVTFEEKPALIATEIVKGDQVLKLRDEKGIPAWAGWRKR